MEMYENFGGGVDDRLADKMFRYELKVIDTDSEEEVYSLVTHSQESLMEDLRKVDAAILMHVNEALMLDYEDISDEE